MATFQVEVDHDLNREEAVDRLRNFSKTVLADLPSGVSEVEEHWADDGSLDFRFKAIGFEFSGNVAVEASHVNVSGVLPFAGLPFRGALETQIAERLKQALDREPA